MVKGPRSLKVAVPELDTYHSHTGIGRVLLNLHEHWGERVHLINTTFKASKLPVLRNSPYGVNTPAGTDLVLLPKLTGAEGLRDTHEVPSIAIVHDVGVVDYPGDREGMAWLSYQSVLRSFRGLQFATHIVAVSHFTGERLKHYLPELEGRVSVIPNGVDGTFTRYCESRDRARQRIEAILEKPLEGPILIYVGSEIPRKNISLLLEIFKGVKQRYPEAKLLKIGGAGHARWRAKTLHHLSRLGLLVGTDVFLLEGMSDHDLARAYHAADVFVSTSLYEGFGLPALEALAVGTPVIVTKKGAMPEVVGEAGWVVEAEPLPFVEAISRIVDHRPDKTWWLKAKKHVEKFGWDNIAKGYLQIMQDICLCQKASMMASVASPSSIRERKQDNCKHEVI